MTIAGTVVQNALQSSLPPAYVASLPAGGAGLAYASIPTIRDLDEPLRSAVRHAFARALRLVWLVMVGFAGAGLLSTLLMREEKMKKSMDERWGLKESAAKTTDTRCSTTQDGPLLECIDSESSEKWSEDVLAVTSDSRVV